MKVDGYLAALLGAIILGLVWPGPGVTGGPLRLDEVNQVGIAAIFFLHGAMLAPRSLRAQSERWRLHALIQGITFLAFPVICFMVYWFGASWLPEEARIGIFFLGALSSTISSSIALTAIARGNVPIAIFNATLSGLLGLFVTPVLMGLLMLLPATAAALAGTLEGQAISASTQTIAMADTFMRIFKLLMLPLLGGQLLHALIGGWLQKRKRATGLFERGVIVLIVLNAFSSATATGLWSQYGPVLLLQIGAIVAGLMMLAVVGCRWLSRAAGLSRADEVAVVFCGSTKSLANGAPLAQIMFGASPVVGMILLPVVLYHSLQLIVIAMMAKAYAHADGVDAATASRNPSAPD